MAAVVLLGQGNATTVEKNTGGNSVTLPIPSNTVVGDVLIAVYVSDQAYASTTTTPGWEKISAARSGGIREVGIFHAFTKDGIPEAPVFVQTGATVTRATVAIYRVVGASQEVRAVGTPAWSPTVDTANTTGFTIPSTGATEGVTLAVAYNNANSTQQATVGANVTFNSTPATTHLTSYGTGAVGSSSSTSAAHLVSSSPGPFEVNWGKAIANSNGQAVTIPSAGGGVVDPVDPEEPEIPDTPDEPGVTVQQGLGNVTTAAANAVGQNSVTLPVPAKTKPNDILLAVVAHSGVSAVSFPEGWSLITTPRSGDNRWMAVYAFKVTSFIPPAPTFAALQEADARISATMLRLTGADSVNFLKGTSTWQADAPTASGSSLALTSTAPGPVVLSVVYNNTNVGVAPAVGTLPGTTKIARSVQEASGRASTVLEVFRSTDGAAKTVSWSPAAANAAGFQLTFQGEQPPVPVTWEAKVMLNGSLAPAVVAAVKVGNQFMQPSVISWEKKDYTIEDLFSTQEFYIAHRGSGDNWPEHTMTSYTNASAYGVKALELSVSLTADNILICHHDLNFLKTAGDSRKIRDMTYAEIQEQIWIDSRQWTGLGTPLVRPPLAKDVIDAYIDTHVIFIEDKGGDGATALLNLMDTYPRGKEKFIWKQWAGAGQWQVAKQRGYKLWGYFMADIFARIPELAPNFDYLGIPHTASDQVISDIVTLGNQMGKPVICWEIHYRWMRDRVRALGVRGMMTSNIPYVYTAQDSAQFKEDTFRTGLRGPGDLPHSTDAGWAVQPQVDPTSGGVLRYVANSNGAYVMGSMCPVPTDAYRVTFEMRWPSSLPGSSDHAGAWFGHDRDTTHRTSTASQDGGYHLIQRVNGNLDLYRHDPGAAQGIPLGSVSAAPPVAGQWMKFEVLVHPDYMEAKRVDLAQPVSLYATDQLYRGKYFGLQKNYTTPTGNAAVPLEYRKVKVDYLDPEDFPPPLLGR